jgi:hypothetical protein
MKDTCPQCGVVINDKSKKYCDNCGFDLKDKDEIARAEEEEFVQGFAHNYPFLKSFAFFVSLAVIGVGLMLLEGNPTFGFITIIIGIILLLVTQIGLYVILQKSIGGLNKK